MTQLDERLSVRTYLKSSIRTVDGLAWGAICIASIFCLFDIWLGTNFIPLREIARPGKAAILLIFSPLLVFLVLVCMRQFPLASAPTMSWIRAFMCIFSFLLINF